MRVAYPAGPFVTIKKNLDAGKNIFLKYDLNYIKYYIVIATKELIIIF
jgi:hypothetical protein